VHSNYAIKTNCQGSGFSELKLDVVFQCDSAHGALIAPGEQVAMIASDGRGEDYRTGVVGENEDCQDDENGPRGEVG
jgi:hypothetical protein